MKKTGNRLPGRLDRIDRAITHWMAENGVPILRVSLGVIFLWFGVLKFFPGLSPAENLAAKTVAVMTGGMVQPAVSLPALATWECAIGLGLIFGVALRLTIVLLLAQMLGTVMPLFFFPSDTFRLFPFAPTLEGQYIIKNAVLVSAALVIGATVRGGRMHDEPDDEPPASDDEPAQSTS